MSFKALKTISRKLGVTLNYNHFSDSKETMTFVNVVETAHELRCISLMEAQKFP